MRRGTTPTITFAISAADGTPLDLTSFEVHMTFKEGKKIDNMVTKEGSDVSVTFDGEKSIVSTSLTQEDTLGFTTGKTVSVQVRAKNHSKAIASDIAKFQVEEILLEGVI